MRRLNDSGLTNSTRILELQALTHSLFRYVFVSESPQATMPYITFGPTKFSVFVHRANMFQSIKTATAVLHQQLQPCFRRCCFTLADVAFLPKVLFYISSCNFNSADAVLHQQLQLYFCRCCFTLAAVTLLPQMLFYISSCGALLLQMLFYISR